MVDRSHLWTAGLVIASMLTLTSMPASPAHADWTLARTDAPVALVRGTNLSTARAGDTLRDGDLLETHEGVAHLQGEHGTLVALGPQTRAMLAADTRVALLHGWLKIAATACVSQACPAPRVDTERGPVDIGANAAAIIATRDDAGAIDLFSETGAQTFAAKPPATIASGRFASIDAHVHLQQSARPSDAFIAAMPVPFRDALQPLSPPKPPPGAAPSRAVNYDDIAPWLVSTLPERKSFPARFRSRVADPAFRRDIDAHLKALPDWRALLYPPARSGVRRARYP
ncbi:hypothetical protein NOV72_01066 [Caballeronia novacaledonica]|uniref:FecR protein n=1 Tax=Caballeronia novacaledonica TaxID=1544861 RepID=A0A2U3I123_9BURK|nr:hypothetical protein [Caballeronia novacaledonica]SPB13801.1 hypothetical protein NOV72_01066 [Caballeronia novacaledonica]